MGWVTKQGEATLQANTNTNNNNTTSTINTTTTTINNNSSSNKIWFAKTKLMSFCQ